MTAYCFVGSEFSNCTSILGALPLGTASDGETYSSLLFCCEYAAKPAIPINANTADAKPSSFILLIALLSMLEILYNWPTFSSKQRRIEATLFLRNPNELAFPFAGSPLKNLL